MVTAAQLHQISPLIPVNSVLDDINSTLDSAGCNTVQRQAMLIGQMCIESDYFRATVEENGAAQKYAPYYGRGWLQLTWESNYAACGAATGLDLINNPDLVLSNNVAVTAWFWNSNNLNSYADAGDCDGCSRAINGPAASAESLALRNKYYQRALAALSS